VLCDLDLFVIIRVFELCASFIHIVKDANAPFLNASTFPYGGTLCENSACTWGLIR